MAKSKSKYYLEGKEYLSMLELSRMYKIKLTSIYRWFRISPSFVAKTRSKEHMIYKIHRKMLPQFEYLMNLWQSNPSDLINTIIELEDENKRLKQILKV